MSQDSSGPSRSKSKAWDLVVVKERKSKGGTTRLCASTVTKR